MAASASKRAKEDDRRKKEKTKEEKEVAKSLKEEMANKKENEESKTAYSKDELVEMLKMRVFHVDLREGFRTQRKWKAASQIIRQWGKFVGQ